MVVHCGYADESGVAALRADPLDVKDVHDAEPHVDRGVTTRVKGLPRQTSQGSETRLLRGRLPTT